jgi:hypothetical protein
LCWRPIFHNSGLIQAYGVRVGAPLNYKARQEFLTDDGPAGWQKSISPVLNSNCFSNAATF